MSLKKAYTDFWRRYFDFKGYSSRKAYWTPTLIHILVAIILGIALILCDVSDISWVVFTMVTIVVLFSISLIIPQLALQVRRLHDINRKGFLVYVNLILGIATNFAHEGSALFNILNIVTFILSVWLFVYMLFRTQDHVEPEQRRWV